MIGDFGGKRWGQHTFIAMPNPPAIDHRLPTEQLIVADGLEALNPVFADRLGVLPGIELL
jgi:hypothetical protein